MLYQYSYRLGAYAPGLDPDAKAYIAAVETALSSSISADQKNAINAFFKTGKSAGWYSSIKRLYLPIWADAAANAIDMITRTSGTFPAPSGVTHDPGYIYSDGSTGYFDYGISPGALGITLNDGMSFCLVTSSASLSGSSFYFASRAGSTSSWLGHRYSGTNLSASMNSMLASITSIADPRGIITTSRSVSNEIKNTLRQASGVTQWTTSLTSSVLNETANMFAMAYGLSGSINPSFVSSSSAQFGAHGLGLGLSDSNTNAFTLALKDLWEDASGLALP